MTTSGTRLLSLAIAAFGITCLQLSPAESQSRGVETRTSTPMVPAPMKPVVGPASVNPASHNPQNTDLKKQCDILRKLVEIADTPAVKVTCMLLLVAIQFDRALSLVTYLPASEWTRCVRTGARASPPGPGLFWRATWEGRGGGAGNGWQKKK